MTQGTSIYFWIGFNLFIACMLALDLFLHRRHHNHMKPYSALRWSIFWIALALGFNVFFYFTHGQKAALDFLAGYLIEKSLSVDNLFVFLVIFKHFKTPKDQLHTVLFYGILGAMIFRALFIFAGIALVKELHWLLYLLGFFLLYTGLQIAFKKEQEIDPEKNMMIKLGKKLFPITDHYFDGKFFVRIKEKLYATPLFLTLLTVEFTDVIFALDSIPAILAITLDPFIAYTSNIFAILGLRALFFTLEASLEYFHYLHYAIGAILVFIGIKLLISSWYDVPSFVALGFIALCLGGGIIFSLLFPNKKS